MSDRSRKVLFLGISAILGIVVGGIITAFLCSHLLSSADMSRIIADTTIDLTALEHVAAGDADGGAEVIRTRLEGSMIGLDAYRGQFSSSQESQVQSILRRKRELCTKLASSGQFSPGQLCVQEFGH
jgi:hypothetical protein